jgi:hypothetical protein
MGAPNPLERTFHSRSPLGCIADTYFTASTRFDVPLLTNEILASKPSGIKAIRQARRRQEKECGKKGCSENWEGLFLPECSIKKQLQSILRVSQCPECIKNCVDVRFSIWC